MQQCLVGLSVLVLDSGYLVSGIRYCLIGGEGCRLLEYSLMDVSGEQIIFFHLTP